MTAEEAKNIMDNLAYYYKPTGDSMEAFIMARKALEKQIPKKPTFDGDGYAPDGTFIWDEWLCPHCGNRYEVDYDEYDYCPNCGQAILWEEGD